jgi:hypothetical protein
VNNSAQLILKKCTLTVDTRCESKMWPGVRVWGNNTVVRNNTSQGYILLDSSCVIMNAWVGIELGYLQNEEYKYNTNVAPTPPGSDSTKAGGGIINCQNSSFINNQRDIYFGDYTSGTGGTCSIFKNTFTTNAYLIGGSTIPPLYHIQLNNYKPNANIQGCTFTCSSSLTASGYAFACQGINSSNSTFTVDKYTTGSVRSVLSNFLYGVYATSNNSNTMAVKNSNLMNNLVGVYMGGITNGAVLSDTFKIYNTTSSSGNVSGLFLDNSTGYKVQDNYITRYSSGNKHEFGIVAYNSGAHVNCIFRNTFKNLYKGSQAQYRNYVSYSSSPHNYVGLVYLCNTFSSGTISNADIYIPAMASTNNISGGTYTSTDTSGIQYNHGSGASGYPETGGNTFSKTSTGSDFYIEPTTGKAYGVNYLYYCPSGVCAGASNRPDNNISSFLTPAPYVTTEVNCSTDPYTHGLRISNPIRYIINRAGDYKLICDSLKNVIASLGVNDSTQKFQLVVKLGDALSTRHRLIDEAIHLLLDNHNDSSTVVVNQLMKEKALELPARSRLETAIYIGDASWAATELANVINQEGQSPFVKVYSVLANNVGKTSEEIMKNPNNVAIMQAIDKDSSDSRAYLMANILLRSVGLSDYKPYYQEDAPQTDSALVRKIKKAESNLISSSSFSSKPNPFKESTTISANIIEKTSNAYIVITNMLGEEVIRYQLQQGQNEVTFNSSDSNQQIFFCTLVIDGMKIKTNKLVLIK